MRNFYPVGIVGLSFLFLAGCGSHTDVNSSGAVARVQSRATISQALQLSSADPSAVLSNVLVMLNNNAGGKTNSLVTALLTSVESSATASQKTSASTAVGALLPYLTPLLSKIGGESNSNLSTIISSVIAATTNSSGTSATTGGSSTAQLASALLPILEGFLSKKTTATAASAKQLFASQLLQGLTNGTLSSNLQVTQDLAGKNGVVLSGLAADLQQIAKLTNVASLSTFTQ